jgi:tRNA nucleotidyltransferase/poly(A) polymerase
MRLSGEAVGLLRQAARILPEPSYLVGGALRDALLGRPTIDLDLAAFEARKSSQKLAKTLGGSFVALDEDNGVYRIVLKEPRGAVRQVDVAKIQGSGIENDLQRRDFTINALALPLSPELSDACLDEARLLDPRGGLPDLGKRLLRTESEERLKEDPLRILRAFRIAAELGLTIEPATLGFISRLRQWSSRPAGERLRSELVRLLDLPGCSAWLRLMDETGVLTSLFEELEPARQCALVYYGKGGVLTHSLDTAARADFLLRRLEEAFPGLGARINEHLDARSGEGSPLRPVLVLAALLHDVSKPETAREVEGRLRFFGHDTAGARRAAAILKRLRFSGAHIDTVSAVVANHLRPGNLAGGPEITDKAVYRFFRDLGEDAVSLLLVCWADHASYLKEADLLRNLKHASKDPESFDETKVQPADARKTIHHLQVIAYLLRRLFDTKRKAVPDSVIDGRDVMEALSLKPGPKVGKLLEEVREAQAEGKIHSRQEALAFLTNLAKDKN